jgi:hypothetical protein
MKIFMSWSGERSKAIAEEFKSFLSIVIQQAQTFISSQDIDLGSIWQKRVLEEVSERRFGLIFITPENKKSEWLHYEAGGLIKDLEKDRVVPILFGIAKKEISSPFSQFQMIEFEKKSVFELIKQINFLTENPVELESLTKLLEAFYLNLEEKINGFLSNSPKKVETRSTEDILTELLLLSREQSNYNKNLARIITENRRLQPSNIKKFNFHGIDHDNEFFEEILELAINNINSMKTFGWSNEQAKNYIDSFADENLKRKLYELFILNNPGSAGGGI